MLAHNHLVVRRVPCRRARDPCAGIAVLRSRGRRAVANGLNRKMLSELAMNEPYSFQALVHRVKTMRGL